MIALKEEFTKELNGSKEVNKVEESVKNVSFKIADKMIRRLKDEKKRKERVAELIKSFIQILKELNIENISTVSAVIDGSLQALSKEKEQEIYAKIATISKLENEIEDEKEQLKEELQEVYSLLEDFSKNLSKPSFMYLENAIKDTKLKELLLLGILKETTEEAIITTIENKKNIEETIAQIIENLISQSVEESEFSKARILEVSKNILDTAVGIADSYQSVAREVLRGTALGIKRGIEKSIIAYNTTLEFMPDELKSDREERILLEGLNIIDLNSDFIELLGKSAEKSNGISKTILNDLAVEFGSSVTKLLKITSDTKENILKKIEKLKENPKFIDLKQKVIEKVEEIKKDTTIKNSDIENITNESKKLGLRAWEIAKNALENAVKNRKEKADENRNKQNEENKR